MLGAIIGDIVGSVYEWSNIKTKDIPLFLIDSFYNVDTVMTIVVAYAIMPDYYLAKPTRDLCRRSKKS